jgi:hypothetical protein
VCVSALLELGTDVAAVNADGATALSRACCTKSLRAAGMLIAAGAANTVALSPGLRQTHEVACHALAAAQVSERGCGKCAARCAGTERGNCADGLDILRAVLAAGGRGRRVWGGQRLA